MLKGYTKAEKSWMLYDWANSAFATIIAAIILPIFFKEIAHQNGVSDVNATAFWGYATSCGTLICAVLAPFMGTLGDFKGMKKKLFTTFNAAWRNQQRSVGVHRETGRRSGAVCAWHTWGSRFVRVL